MDDIDAPLPPATPDRILGCLAGGAVADAVGYQVEFDKLPAILAERGPRGVTGPARGEPLLASDDTQMSLFTAEGMVRAARASGAPSPAAAVVAEVREAYLDWLETQTLVPGGRKAVGCLVRDHQLQRRRAPGMTCLSALGQGGSGTRARRINDSKGCGGVMRVAPLGLVFHGRGSAVDEAEAAFGLGADTTALTHGHPQGWLSAGAMAAIVRLVSGGWPIAEAARLAARLASVPRPHAPVGDRERTAALIRVAVELAETGAGLDPEGIERGFGGGWTGEEALAIGLYAALAGRDFADAVRIGATHSGDSDSTASVAGQILGARDGFACVPAEWWAGLDLRQQVGDMAAALAAAFRASEWAPPPTPPVPEARALPPAVSPPPERAAAIRRAERAAIGHRDGGE